MNKNKEKSTGLVLFTIFVLLLFIVLPPVFRVLFPKVEIDTNNDKVITVLNCSRDSYSDGYHINIKSKYIDNKIKSSEIVISPLDVNNGNIVVDDNQNIVNNTDTASYITASQMVTFFSSLNNIQIEYNDAGTKILIDSKLINNNSEQVELNSYFTDLDIEEKYFINQGYKCNTISS